MPENNYTDFEADYDQKLLFFWPNTKYFFTEALSIT